MSKIIICDLDGTLCDITHRLKYIKQDKPDWDLFYSTVIFDRPKPEIIQLIKTMMASGVKVIITSGRSDVAYEATIKWIEYFLGTFKDNPMLELIMRPHGDYTKDDVLKENWLHKGLLGSKEDILFALDDRQRVVDMWRRNGLTCLQVAQWEE